MLEQMMAACAARLDESDLDLSKDGHKKYRGLLRKRPEYFLAVRPGAWRAYEISWASTCPTLLPVEGVPPFRP
jgi:hypothetical protein